MSSKRYTEEFKTEAVRQVTERGYSVAEVAGRLGMTTHSLYAWKMKYGPNAAEHEERTATENEVRRLKKELKRVTEERPHQGLNGAYPGDIYTPSTRAYEPPPELEYPYHDRIARVTRCGRTCFGRRKINISTVFGGQTVGIREVADQIWLVSLWIIFCLKATEYGLVISDPRGCDNYPDTGGRYKV